MTRATKIKDGKPVITEKAFQASVIQLAKQYKWKVYFTWRSIHSPAGFPDLVFCRPPRLIFAELKSEKGELTEPQADWYDALCQCRDYSGNGISVCIWRPSDFPAIKKILD